MPARTRLTICVLAAALAAPTISSAEPPALCSVEKPTATFRIGHVSGNPTLSVDPQSPVWRSAAFEEMLKDCSREIAYGNLKSEIKAFWTDTDLYFLFRCPYTVLNLFEPPQNDSPRTGLWDRDVVEMFLGEDWTNIRHYREFEIAPTGDWIDLAIDLDHDSYDKSWRSGWQTKARIDTEKKIWYAAARIPLRAVSATPVQAGMKWRMNLYRIDGFGADPQRHFLCWQPTCVVNRDPNHVPEHFGTLLFEGVGAGRSARPGSSLPSSASRFRSQVRSKGNQ